MTITKKAAGFLVLLAAATVLITHVSAQTPSATGTQAPAVQVPALQTPAPAAAQTPAPSSQAEQTPAVQATTAKNPALPHNLSPWGMFMGADIVVKAVMIGLAFASLLTWTI